MPPTFGSDFPRARSRSSFGRPDHDHSLPHEPDQPTFLLENNIVKIKLDLSFGNYKLN